MEKINKISTYGTCLKMAIHLDANVPEQIVEALFVAVLGGGEGGPELRSRLPAVEEHQLLAIHDVEGGLQPGLAIKDPSKKTTQKTHLKKTTKNVFFVCFFWVFSKFFIFMKIKQTFLFETDL
jgi:hypothetical protein